MPVAPVTNGVATSPVGRAAPSDRATPPDRAELAKLADPYARSALLLCESLIHALVDKGVLTTAEAVDLIDVALEVEEELADDASDGPLRTRLASPLATLANSFRNCRP